MRGVYPSLRGLGGLTSAQPPFEVNMKQSVYTKISKKIGWEITPLRPEVPRYPWLHILLDAARAESEVAFEYLFILNRFSESPTDAEERLRLGLCTDAFRELSAFWQSVPADGDRPEGKANSPNQRNLLV